MRIRFALAAGLLIAAAFPASREVAESRAFEEANQFYRRGQYVEALRIYEDLLKIRGNTPELLFNAGNAAFQIYRDPTATNREGKLALALHHYEHARRLAPWDENTAYNADFARRLVADRVNAPEPNALLLALFFYYYLWAPGSLALAAAVAALAAALAFALRLRLPSHWEKWRVSSMVIAFVGLGLWALLLGSAVVKYRATRLDAVAWIRTESADLRSGPSSEAKVSMELHEGTRVRVLRREDGWALAQLEDGRQDWVSEERLLP